MITMNNFKIASYPPHVWQITLAHQTSTLAQARAFRDKLLKGQSIIYNAERKIAEIDSLLEKREVKKDKNQLTKLLIQKRTLREILGVSKA